MKAASEHPCEFCPKAKEHVEGMTCRTKVYCRFCGTDGKDAVNITEDQRQEWA